MERLSMDGVCRVTAARRRTAASCVARAPALIHSEMSRSSADTASGSGWPPACRARMRSSTAETVGVKDAIWSCMARTAPEVQRRLLVSKGTCVDNRRNWVMSLARTRRSRSFCSAVWPLSVSCIQLRASRTALSSCRVRAGARPRGSTMLWTSVAQTMPRLISSTRASAVSNTREGSVTLGKPIIAAV
ncbi:hypothetical protein D9M68_531660 [compost metagenome]